MDIPKLFGMPINASAHGTRIDSMLLWIHVLMLVLFVGWGIFYVYCLVRFRAKRNAKADHHGVKNHASSWLEGGVALIEAMFLVALAFPIWSEVKAKAPSESDADVVVDVVAQQFAWNIHYPGKDGQFGRRDINLITDDNVLGLDRRDPKAKDDISTINQLNLPVDKLVLVRLMSQDVVHSFALQEMRVKQDAIPGMEFPVYFTPVKTGQWEISCAQLCGLGHYRMRGQTTVQTKAEFEQWLAEQALAPEEAPAQAASPDPATSPDAGAATNAPADTAHAEAALPHE
jgi:cytochrome c oxidase subunit 2